MFIKMKLLFMFIITLLKIKLLINCALYMELRLFIIICLLQFYLIIKLIFVVNY